MLSDNYQRQLGFTGSQFCIYTSIHSDLINLVSAYVLAEALRTELTGWGAVCSLQKPGEASARGTPQCQGCQPGSTRKLPPAHEESIISKLTGTRNIAPVFAHA